MRLCLAGNPQVHDGGSRTPTVESLLQLKQSLREKHALLSALVLSGEIVRADIILDGLRDLVAEWKEKRLFDLKQDCE